MACGELEAAATAGSPSPQALARVGPALRSGELTGALLPRGDGCCPATWGSTAPGPGRQLPQRFRTRPQGHRPPLQRRPAGGP